jgi:hypothetical protein
MEFDIDNDTKIFVHRLFGDESLNLEHFKSLEDLQQETNRLKALLNITDESFVDFESIFKAQESVQERENEFGEYYIDGNYRGFVLGVSQSWLNSYVPFTKFPTMEARFEDGTRKKWREFLVVGNKDTQYFVELREVVKNSCNIEDFKLLYNYMESLVSGSVKSLSEAILEGFILSEVK